MSLATAYDNRQTEIAEQTEFCNELYNKLFYSTLKPIHDIRDKFNSTSIEISDEDLEYIITGIPIQLISVSEILSNLQLERESIKLHIHKKYQDLYTECQLQSDTKKREYANYNVLEDKQLLVAYNTIISRVEREISYSRELIMGAKKVWDARQKTYNMNPISENSLPDYDFQGQK